MRQTLLHIDTIGDEIDKIFDAYFAGDVEAMARIVATEDDTPGVQAYMEKVMFARNKTMAQSIDRLLMDPGPYFIVVGVGHLVGERNLLGHLERKGYGVKRVSPKGIPVPAPLPKDVP